MRMWSANNRRTVEEVAEVRRYWEEEFRKAKRTEYVLNNRRPAAWQPWHDARWWHEWLALASFKGL